MRPASNHGFDPSILAAWHEQVFVLGIAFLIVIAIVIGVFINDSAWLIGKL